MAFWMKPDLWEYEVKDMASIYPDAQWRNVHEKGTDTRAWQLIMEPIPNKEELHYILYDLNRGVRVSIGQNGKISHSRTYCELPLVCHPLFLPKVRLVSIRYLIDLTYPIIPQNAAGPVQPKVRIIMPEISARVYPKHPHMYCDPRYDSWVCPLSPQNSQWNWQKGATVSYLDQVAIWILKTAIWAKTGAGIAGLGIWIGSDTPHRALDHLNMIKSTDPCWCGSGICYEKCHMKQDILQAIGNRIYQQENHVKEVS